MACSHARLVEKACVIQRRQMIRALQGIEPENRGDSNPYTAEHLLYPSKALDLEEMTGLAFAHHGTSQQPRDARSSKPHQQHKRVTSACDVSSRSMRSK
jgi:hypothetical protein